MKTITPAGSSLSLQDVLAAPEGATVSFHGMAHAVRDLGDVCFVLLRTAQGALQCVVCPPLTPPRPGDALRVQGTVCRDARARGRRQPRLCRGRLGRRFERRNGLREINHDCQRALV